jgi:molybdopterin-guanine dinucleotide biosynthesis protein A
MQQVQIGGKGQRMRQVSAVILAGGRSSRLGRDKAFVKLGGKPLIDRVLKVVTALSDDVLIVADDLASYGRLGHRVVTDTFPGAGSLGGIYSGLWAARHEQALVVGCDMPFLNRSLLQYMIAQAGPGSMVVPRYDNYLEPLHALYHRRALSAMRALIEADNLRISPVFDHLPTRYITAQELDRFDRHRRSFFNVNRPADLVQARRLVASGRGDSPSSKC